MNDFEFCEQCIRDTIRDNRRWTDSKLQELGIVIEKRLAQDPDLAAAIDIVKEEIARAREQS